MTMKRIFIIFCLLGLILNSFGQELSRDIIYVEDELYIRGDTTIIELIEEHAPSATARNAGNGLRLVGNDLDIGGTLDSSLTIKGAGNSVEIGTFTSKIQSLNIAATSDIGVYSDGDIYLSNNGVEYLMQGNYIVNNNTGDTVANLDDVRTLIATSEKIFPFNWEYTFNSSIVDSRPGIGLFRFNNATLSNVTEIYIDYFDVNSISKNNFLSQADTGSVIAIQTDNNNYAVYKLNGGYVDNGNYFTYNVTYSGHNGTISGLNTINLDVSNNRGSGGLVDSIYVAWMNEYVSNLDTIQKNDSTWKEITSEVANIDTVKTQYMEGSTVTFSNNIYSENNITATNQLISRGRLFVGTSGTITGGYQSEIDNIDGLLNLDQDGATTNNLTVPLLNINRTSTSASSNDITANIINITDSPTTSGTVSGKVLSASIDGTERISLNPRSTRTGTAHYFDTDSTFTTGNLLAVANNADTLLRVTKDTLFADSLTAKVKGISIGEEGTVITGDTTSKFVMENTEVDKIQFHPTNQIYSDGTLFYDSVEKSLSFYNEFVDFKEEISRGINVVFFNNTGSTITNGTVVRSVGAHKNSSINFEGDLAGNASLDSILGVAVATHDVLDGEHGMATVLGQVNGLNTSAFSDNDIIYVGHAGAFTNTPPEPPLWYQILGRVVYADNDSGAIYIKTGETKYSPAPTFTARFEDSTETITNPGLGVYEQITSATYSLFEEKRNVGFEFQGDSISPLQDGNYTIFFSYSFQGTVSQTDLYRIGTFIDGVKEYSTSRTASGTNNGGVPYPVTVYLTTGQWISFRVENETSGIRDCVFTDGTITINFSE